MKKIKLLIASMIGAIALVFACVLGTKVNATTVSTTWKADDETVDTAYSVSTNSGLVSTKTGFFKISTKVANSTITSDKSSAIADDDNTKSFSTALLCSATTDGSSKGYYELETLTDALTIKIYYTMTNKDFGSKDQSKSGNLIYQIGSNSAVTSSKTGDKSNKTAYTDSFDVASSGSKVKLYSSSNRLAIFAITASYEAASEDQTSIKFYDDSNLLDTIIYNNGDSIVYEPVKTNYTFNGWYTNADLTEEHKLADNYTVDGTITTLYAKFTENAKFIVSYYVDGSLYHTDGNAYVGTSITYKPSFDEYGLDGWYTDIDCTQALADNYTVSSNISLFGKKIKLNYSLKFDSTINESNELTSISEKYNNTIFDLNIGMKQNNGTTYSGVTYAYSVSTGGASFNGVKLRTIDFKAPYDGQVNMLVYMNEASKKVYLTDLTRGLSNAYDSFVVSASKTATEVSFDVVGGTNYSLALEGNGRFYFVEFVKTPEISDDVTLTFGHQFNEATALASDKLRFIGKIEGIDYADTADITSVVFSFRFNNNDRTANCYKLYKAVTNLGEDAADSTLYVVYTLKNINKAAYANMSLTNIKMTVTFSDGSTKEISHDNIALPNYQ